jgi:7,8-dihydropterin-6-yl-methyl-4-(beta-D-ribofuranosyl)aminobenzene 5'-phosphate synthase
MSAEVDKPLTITVVYDNNTYAPGLTTDWGFAAVVNRQGCTLLFDTGADGSILLDNMKALKIDPAHIDLLVISHAHQDHTGGLQGLLAAGAKPTIYLPASFPRAFTKRLSPLINICDTYPGEAVADDIYVTGEIPGPVAEQALVIDTVHGLVVITGCAHPGVVQIVKRARELTGKSVHLVLGGFHLRRAHEAEVRRIVSQLRREGVGQIAPCHCTGERAIDRFAEEYGDNFIRTGVGRVITL